MHNYQFCSDSEGPLCLNDNAFELAQVFVPQGDKLFAVLSAYDDYLADIVKRPGYKAGDTLRLILPFLKAYGATNKTIEDYSRQAVNWVPQAREALGHIRARLPLYIITTSYEQFAYPMYQGLGIPKDNIYCTRLDLDRYHIDIEEVARLKTLAREIIAMPQLVPEDPLSDDTAATAERLDEIFWQEIYYSQSGQLLQNVQVMGGAMKAQAIGDSLKHTGFSPDKVMFVGDSITDVEAFKLVRKIGGVSISFNGNAYAIDAAEIACVSNTAYTAAAMAYAFADGGREQVYALINQWDEATLHKLEVPADLIKHLFADPNDSPQIDIITTDNRRRIITASQQMRKSLRGKQIGTLG